MAHVFQANRNGDHLSDFYSQFSASEAAIQHFESTPWTGKFLLDSRYQACPTYARILKHDGEDSYFSRTLNTPTTIPHMLTLHKTDRSSVPTSELPSAGVLPVQPTGRSKLEIHDPDTITLVAVAATGLNGNPSIVHGGVVSALLDEAMGECLMSYRHFSKVPSEETTVTGTLQVRFLRPLQSGCDYVLKTRIVARSHRKWMMHSRIDDEDSTTIAIGDAIWVSVLRTKL